MSIATTTPGTTQDDLLRREQAKAVFDLLRSIRDREVPERGIDDLAVCSTARPG
jgi:hypothetical protein